jgi:hypothetical protein
MNSPVTSSGVNDRDEWRARILRALSELREGDHRVLRSYSQSESDDEAPATLRNP